MSDGVVAELEVCWIPMNDRGNVHRHRLEIRGSVIRHDAESSPRSLFLERRCPMIQLHIGESVFPSLRGIPLKISRLEPHLKMLLNGGRQTLDKAILCLQVFQLLTSDHRRSCVEGVSRKG